MYCDSCSLYFMYHLCIMYNFAILMQISNITKHYNFELTTMYVTKKVDKFLKPIRFCHCCCWGFSCCCKFHNVETLINWFQAQSLPAAVWICLWVWGTGGEAARTLQRWCQSWTGPWSSSGCDALPSRVCADRCGSCCCACGRQIQHY